MAESIADIPLFRRAPELAGRVPHMSLGSFPSAIEHVELDDDGRRIPLLVKRDDVIADGYAGNKVRKLEFLLADARARDATRLITAGAAGSHHAFATAHYGRIAGFDVTLVLFPQVLTPHVREMLMLDVAVGAKLVWASRLTMVPYGLLRARLAHIREATCVVPPGGSSDLGTLGYINGGLELVDQIEQGLAPRPSSIHVAAGTLGTVAGIGIALAWAGADIPVVATRITARLLTNETTLASLVRSTLEHMRRSGARDLPDADAVMRRITMRHDQIGDGYGHATQAGRRAAHLFADAGLRLDDTYTAKAAASLIEDAGQGTAMLPLFWNTLSAVEPSELLRGVSASMLPPRFARYLDDADAILESMEA